MEIEDKSPTRYSKSTIWTLDADSKAIGSALSATEWNHVTINLPPSDVETQVIRSPFEDF